MGGLIPNPHDDSVKDKLDKQFSNQKLRNLRNRIRGPGATEPNFFTDPNPANVRHLARISHRLKVWPEPDTASGEPPPTTPQLKARWQYLLQVSLTDPVSANQGGKTVADLIREALQVFVVTDAPNPGVPGAPTCTAITFDAVQAPLAAPLEYQVNIAPALNARPPRNYVAKITLVCRQDIPPNSNRPDPGGDNGEVPPVQPNFDPPPPKPKPRKKYPAKKTKKKKKKAAKKVGKKKARKAAKK
jgi:hypothetical protein